MTEFEEILKRLDERLDSLEKLLRGLQPSYAQFKERAEYFESLPRDAIVGYDYFCWRTGLSKRQIQHGECGVLSVPLNTKKPKSWRKSDIDFYQANRAKPVSEKAAELRAKANVRPRRKSLIKRGGV